MMQRWPQLLTNTPIGRADFLRLMVLAALAPYLPGCTPGKASEPVPLYAARHPSGVWGLTVRQAASEGTLAKGPDGVIGVAKRASAEACALRYADGTVGLQTEAAPAW